MVPDFSVVPTYWTRTNDNKHEKFQLSMRKNFFIMRVVEQ